MIATWYWQGRVLPLQLRAMRLLGVLAQKPGVWVSRSEVLDRINEEWFERTVDSYVKHLRNGLRGTALHVDTLYAKGYRIRVGELFTGTQRVVPLNNMAVKNAR